MVRSAMLARDRFDIYNDLEEEERAALESNPNNSYATRLAQNNDRGMLVERGLDTEGLEETTIPAAINNRGWHTFSSTREGYHEDLVSIFYASMVPEVFNGCGRVWVQGVQVQITPEAINDYLETPVNPNDEYADGFLVENNFHPSLRRIAVNLRRNGNDVWVPGTTELQHGELEPDLAFWSVFIKHSLTPSTHRTVLSVETARILYAIQTGVHFDVGHFIFNSILKTGCDTRCLLTFPCLITHFCRIAGIMEAFDDNALQAPPADICKKAYNSFCTRHGVPTVRPGRRIQDRRGAARQQQQDEHQGGVPPWGQQIIHQVTEVRERLDRVLDHRHSGTTYQRRNRRDGTGPSSSRHHGADED